LDGAADGVLSRHTSSIARSATRCRSGVSQWQPHVVDELDGDASLEYQLVSLICAQDGARARGVLARMIGTRGRSLESVARLLCAQDVRLINETWALLFQMVIETSASTRANIGVSDAFTRLLRVLETETGDDGETSQRSRSNARRALLLIVRTRRGIFDPALHSTPRGPPPSHDTLSQLLFALVGCIRCSTVMANAESATGRDSTPSCEILRTALRVDPAADPCIWLSPHDRRPRFATTVLRAIALSSATSGPDTPQNCFTSKYAVAVATAELCHEVLALGYNNRRDDPYIRWGYTLNATLKGYDMVADVVLGTTMTFYSHRAVPVTDRLDETWCLLFQRSVTGAGGSYRSDTARCDGANARGLGLHPLLSCGQLFFWMFLDTERVRMLICRDVAKPFPDVLDSVRRWAPLLKGIVDAQFDESRVAHAVEELHWLPAFDRSEYSPNAPFVRRGDLHLHVQESREAFSSTVGRLARAVRRDDLLHQNVQRALDNARIIAATAWSPSLANETILPLCARERRGFVLILACARRPPCGGNVLALLPADVWMDRIFTLVHHHPCPHRASWFAALPLWNRYSHVPAATNQPKFTRA
tara:strand:- start:1434 stop:3209 length:1776 start_codon:yes stop_codon:yes gene_type:complete